MSWDPHPDGQACFLRLVLAIPVISWAFAGARPFLFLSRFPPLANKVSAPNTLPLTPPLCSPENSFQLHLPYHLSLFPSPPYRPGLTCIVGKTVHKSRWSRSHSDMRGTCTTCCAQLPCSSQCMGRTAAFGTAPRVPLPAAEAGIPPSAWVFSSGPEVIYPGPRSESTSLMGHPSERGLWDSVYESEIWLATFQLLICEANRSSAAWSH